MKCNYLLVSILVLSSCKSGLMCDHEKELFQEKWYEKVKEVYRSDQYKNTFVIETLSGKRISFQPPQNVVYLSSYGDSLIKKANSFEVEIRTADRDTFFSMVSSVTYDTVVMRELGFEYNRWADIVKIKKKKMNEFLYILILVIGCSYMALLVVRDFRNKEINFKILKITNENLNAYRNLMALCLLIFCLGHIFCVIF